MIVLTNSELNNIIGYTNKGYYYNSNSSGNTLGTYKGFYRGLHWFTYGF